MFDSHGHVPLSNGRLLVEWLFIYGTPNTNIFTDVAAPANPCGGISGQSYGSFGDIMPDPPVTSN